MAVADELQEARMALRMIHPDPFNAEAPPEALTTDITPTELHYVRSNFGVPVHDGRLEVSGAVDNPTTLTLDDLRAMPAVEHVVTLECAGNGRLEMRPLPVGEPWGDYAVSTARWTGALLHEVLERAHPARRPDRATRRRIPDGPLHVPVARSTPRGRHSHARARPHYRPGSRRDHCSRQIHRAREGLVGRQTGNAGRRELNRRGRLEC